MDDLIGKLKNGLSPDAVEPIRVFQHNGKTYTLDNRRLPAFFYAGVKDIPVVPVDPTDPKIAAEIRRKFQPINGGKMVVVTPRNGRDKAQKLLEKFKKHDPSCR